MVALLVASLAAPVFGEKFYLYTPSQATGEEKPKPGDGVLVQEIPIQKGDTLSGLSRKFSGKGSHYPQILLFNDIRNPNLIYAGDTIKVPLSDAEPQQHEAAKSKHRHKPATSAGKKHTPQKHDKSQPAAKASIELQPGDLKVTGAPATKPRKSSTKHRAGRAGDATPATKASGEPAEGVKTAKQNLPSFTPESVDTKTDARLFEKALKAYRQDDCRTAIELFDRFLAENASSPQAADASLYKADCLLKQAVQ